MTALLTDEAVQFYDLSVECGSYCQGGRSRLEPTSWPDDYSVVKYPDHLAAIARYEARLAEDAKVRAGLVEALSRLVRANEEWNADVRQVIGRMPKWTDGYLDDARAALALVNGDSKPKNDEETLEEKIANFQRDVDEDVWGSDLPGAD